MRTLASAGHRAVGLDVKPSPYTHCVGSIADRGFVRACMQGVGVVLHTATLHKPHVATHSRQDFVDVNVTGTLNLLEEAAVVGVQAFIFTSTTSVYGRALTPTAGAPAAWITEDVVPIPKNIYGVTKLAAEHLCELFHRDRGLPCLILRTSRFFPEADDRRETREAYADTNAKVNELLYRRADVEDIVTAHLRAMDKARSRGFGRYIISASTPFAPGDLAQLRADAPAVVARHVPEYAELYAARGWKMFPSIDRVYVNERARRELEWRPRYDFASAIERIREHEDHRSALAQAIGSKGYHDIVFEDGPYPT